MKFCRRFRFVDKGVLIHGGSLEYSEMIRRFKIREEAMTSSHVEEGGEQVRGKDSGPSTRMTSLVMPFLALRDDSSG